MARGRSQALHVTTALLTLALWCAGASAFPGAPTVPGSPDTLFEQAEQLKSADNAKFRRLIGELSDRQALLTREQYWHLRYLEAWQLDYVGDMDGAGRLLEDVIAHTGNPTLKIRAIATLVNVLGFSRRYEEAYQRLDELITALPSIHDATARFQALGEASQLLTSAGQYDLAIQYAKQMLDHLPQGEGGCRAWFHVVHAEFRAGTIDATNPRIQEVIRQCDEEHQALFAQVLRGYVAAMHIREGHPRQAIKLLQAQYRSAMDIGYVALSAQFNALLAKAYYLDGKLDEAKRYAGIAISFLPPNGTAEWLGMSYEVLYDVERARGNYKAALQWHEKYMAASQGYLNNASVQALAYQRVRQQLQARKADLERLNNQNRILQLQQALDRKEVQASRLSIVLLATVLASVALWVFRLKRSQRRFIRLARHDGLTGIFNRQHFVEQAEKILTACAREQRPVCLILLDLDHFKLINDSHGHAIGDQVLRRAVAVSHDHLRKTDIFGRLGGEEFGILLPDCTIERVAARAEAIRLSIAGTSAEDEAQGATVSASLGIACTESAGYDLRGLMADADDALYRAKRSGRNRVVVDGQDEIQAEDA